MNKIYKEKKLNILQAGRHMCGDVYFKENLTNTKASHGTFGQLILLLFKSLLSKLRRTRASFRILALPEPSRFPAHKSLASSSYIIHWINISFEYLLWSIQPPHFLPSHRNFQWTTFLSLWKPLHKVRRLHEWKHILRHRNQDESYSFSFSSWYQGDIEAV